jgi:hypothetical protein
MDGSIPEAVPGLWGGLHEASVTGVSDTVVRCDLADSSLDCRVATLGYRPSIGDRVLVARGPTGHFVVGVLGAARSCLRAPDGTVAELDAEGGLTVRLGDDSVVFQRRADGTTSLSVRVDEVSLAGAKRVELSSHDATITLNAGGVAVSAPRTTVAGAAAQVTVDDARVEAKVLTTVADRMRAVAGSVETRAASIVSRARTVMTEVEELAQTRGGILRFIAREGFHVRGRRAVVKADEDVKLKGQKIYLA